MESTRIYNELVMVYEESHEQLIRCINLSASEMLIWEAGQVHEMVSKDLKLIYKRIKWLQQRNK